MTPIERAREAIAASLAPYGIVVPDDLLQAALDSALSAQGLVIVPKQASEALLIEANRLRQIVEHLHALVHSQLGAAETVRKAQLVLSKAMNEAMDFPPVLSPHSPSSGGPDEPPLPVRG